MIKHSKRRKARESSKTRDRFSFASNDYQQKSRIAYIFLPNRNVKLLLVTNPSNQYFFESMEVKFTVQNFRSLEVKD